MPKSGGGHIFMVPIDLPKCPNATPTVRSTHTQLRADNDNHLQIYTSDGQSRTVYDSSNLPSTGMENPMTDAGDIIVGGTDGEPERLGKGTANHVLGVNNAGTGLEYSDGSAIPAVARNTTDIEALKYQVNLPSDLFFTATETSTGSGIYELSLEQPTSESPVTLTSSVSDTEAKLFEFQYIFPATGTIYKNNQYSILLPLSDLSTSASYTMRYVLKHIDSENVSTNIANFTANAFQPSVTTYTVQEDLPDILENDLAYSAGDKFVIEVYGAIDSGTSDCNLVVEDTSLLAVLNRQIPVANISAVDVVTTIGGTTTNQQSFNETVNTAIANVMSNPMTTAGDIIVGGASGAPTRLGLGTANQALTVNSDATGIAYSDGSAIPAVAQNTQDIANIEYQINTPTEFYLTSDETSTGSGVYVLSTTTPTAVSGTTLSASVSSTSAKIFEFSYTFPANTVINTRNSFTPNLPFSGLDTTKTYALSFVLNHVAQDSTITQVASGDIIFTPESTTYTYETKLNSLLSSELSCSFGDKLVLEIYGGIVVEPTTFTSESLPDSATTKLNGVCYGAGKFVAVGNGGKIYTSPDGETWTEQTSDVSGDLPFVYYANGKFISRDNSSKNFLISSDGVTWEKVYAGQQFVTSSQRCGCYGAGKYITLGSEAKYYSTDGTSWSRSSGGVAAYDVCYTDSHGFVAVGGTGYLFNSTNGTSWTSQQYKFVNYNMLGICYGNGIFVAVGSDGSTNNYGKIYTSQDGETWTNRTSATFSGLSKVRFADNVFVAVGRDGIIMTSSDGVNWTTQTSGVSTLLFSVVNDGSGNYSIVGDSGTVLLGTSASATGISCDLDVEDPADLALLHEDIPPYILAENVHTTINNVNQTQQTYNESVATSLSGKQNTLTAGTGIDITSDTISATKATSSALGIVRPDNSTITVNSSGVISCSVTSGMTNPMTTQGDIIVGGSSGTPDRLGIGTTGQVLTVNSNADGVTYQDLPIATTLSAGIVQPDGITVTINNGVISSTGSGSVTTFRYWN